MKRAAFGLLLLAGCPDEKTPTCEEAVRHVAGIMKNSKTESKRTFWTTERVVAGQVAFCESEKTDPRLLRCVMKMTDEEGYEHCIKTFGGPR